MGKDPMIRISSSYCKRCENSLDVELEENGILRCTKSDDEECPYQKEINEINKEEAKKILH